MINLPEPKIIAKDIAVYRIEPDTLYKNLTEKQEEELVERGFLMLSSAGSSTYIFTAKNGSLEKYFGKPAASIDVLVESRNLSGLNMEIPSDFKLKTKSIKKITEKELRACKAKIKKASGRNFDRYIAEYQKKKKEIPKLPKSITNDGIKSILEETDKGWSLHQFAIKVEDPCISFFDIQYLSTRTRSGYRLIKLNTLGKIVQDQLVKYL